VSTESRLEATIEVIDTNIGAGDEFRYRINNIGTVPLICGLSYRLERETAKGWVPMNPRTGFRAIGFGVLPGEGPELRATIPRDGPSGPYRISTSVRSDHVEGDVRHRPKASEPTAARSKHPSRRCASGFCFPGTRRLLPAVASNAKRGSDRGDCK
jgi:hypothetical protein